jgi:hypothetical protein
MSFAAFVATVIIVLFLVTIVMAIGSYGAYKLRERRRPGRANLGSRDDAASVYFERVEASELEGGGRR